MVNLFGNSYLNSGGIAGSKLYKKNLMFLEKLQLKIHLPYLLIERLSYQNGKMIWIANFYLVSHLLAIHIFCLRIYVHGDALSLIIKLDT